MEVKKIPSWYERQQVFQMARRLGLKVADSPEFKTDENGVEYPVNTDAIWILYAKPNRPVVPYKMTFYELRDYLILHGGVLEDVV